jgi:hypothetical protein
MYKKDSVRQLMESYKITLTKRLMQRRYRSTPHSYGAIDSFDSFSDYIQEVDVPTMLIEVEESCLQLIADKIVEFDDLMKDPETARLLMEARFINRLKGNR